MTQRIVLPSAADTEAFGARLARALPADAAGAMVTLKGDLGAGKTALARAFLMALGHRGPVPSPTYTLVEPYEVLRYPVYHIDLYRIASGEELEFLGWDDLRRGLVLIEWPERAPELTANADLAIELAYRDAGREAAVQTYGALGARWASNL